MGTLVVIITSAVATALGFFIGYKNSKKAYKEKVENIEKQLQTLLGAENKEELKQIGKALRRSKKIKNKGANK